MKTISIYAVIIAFIAVLTLSVVNTAKAAPTGYPVDQKKWEAWWQDGQAVKQTAKTNPTGYPVDQKKWEVWWQDGGILTQNVKAQPLDYPVDEVCWQSHASGSPSRS